MRHSIQIIWRPNLSGYNQENSKSRWWLPVQSFLCIAAHLVQNTQLCEIPPIAKYKGWVMDRVASFSLFPWIFQFSHVILVSFFCLILCMWWRLIAPVFLLAAVPKKDSFTDPSLNECGCLLKIRFDIDKLLAIFEVRGKTIIGSGCLSCSIQNNGRKMVK